ncbi:MAG: SRPBCC family protein [Verrucomicrobiota bacterium]
MYWIERSQTLPTTLTEAWDFIKTPANLNRITPDDLDFKIITDLPEEMTDGLLIEYRIGIPLLGRRTWLSEIKHIRPRHSFVDDQRVGPYKLWYHYHQITEAPDNAGVTFLDRVAYEVPFSFIGKIAHPLFIRPTLERIFDHRQSALAQIFSKD